MHHRPIVTAFAITHRLYHKLSRQCRVASHTRLPTQGSGKAIAHPCLQSQLHHLRVGDEPDGRILGLRRMQSLEHARGIGIPTRSRIVLRIGNHHRLLVFSRQSHGFCHCLIWAEEIHRPIGLMV